MERTIQKWAKLLVPQLLVYFDPNLELSLTSDASAYGIGAGLSLNARWHRESVGWYPKC